MRPTPPQRRALVAVGVPALVVTLGIGGVLVSGPRTDGPLTATSAITVEFELTTGRVGTWGVVLPTNPTISPITIESIEAVDVRGVTIVGMLINDPEREGGVGTLDVYPPPGVHGRAVEGVVLPPIGADGVHRQLLIGVRLTGAGDGSIHALRVSYRHAGTGYEAVLPYSLRLRAGAG